APCSNGPITSSLTSPDNHSSTVFHLLLSPCNLSMAIGLTSINELVRKYSIPLLVDAKLTLDHAFYNMDACVKNCIKGPLALLIAVLLGCIVSSPCFIVSAVT